jgi:two-component SAPR family response regulator
MDKTDLKMPGMLVPDPLSSLIQLQARRLGVEVKWSGKGNEDLWALLVDDSNKTILSKQLWNGLKELWEMPELKQLPEPVYAKICAVILAARARTDLDLQKRNALVAAGAVPPPAPIDNGPARPL